MRHRIGIVGMILFGWVAGPLAQSNPLYVQFSPGTVKGALYKPDSGPAPHVAILMMHRTGNQLSGQANTELAKRGFMVLGMNSRFDNNEASVEWEQIALDVKSGVEFLRKQPGITKVILYGASGGGPTMTFYQAVAEKGPAYCQGPNKLVECGSNLAGLPRADSIVFRDGHPGISVNALRGLNPAVIKEGDPRQINPDLDPYSPGNGFKPDQPSSAYSDAFKKKYFEGQSARMNRLIDDARAQLKQIKAGKGPYTDNDAFVVVRALGGRMVEMDMSVHHSTLKPQKLLKNDGTVEKQIVESVRVVNPRMQEQNDSFEGGAQFLTLRSFLSANAIRSTNALDGIDWCSSNNSSACALQNISVPILLGAMGGYYFVRDNEILFDLATSPDKDFIVVEGALHGGTPCTACEKVPGQYSNTIKNYFDYVQKWINARF